MARPGPADNRHRRGPWAEPRGGLIPGDHLLSRLSRTDSPPKCRSTVAGGRRVAPSPHRNTSREAPVPVGWSNSFGQSEGKNKMDLRSAPTPSVTPPEARAARAAWSLVDHLPLRGAHLVQVPFVARRGRLHVLALAQRLQRYPSPGPGCEPPPLPGHLGASRAKPKSTLTTSPKTGTASVHRDLDRRGGAEEGSGRGYCRAHSRRGTLISC